jgi:hypothetical protein
MKGFRNALRVMIVAGSVTGFFSGWVMLAHTVAGKSTQATQSVSVASAPAGATLPPLDLKALAPQGDIQGVNAATSVQTSNQATSGLQQLPTISQQPAQGFIPRMRTSGS